MDVRLLPLWEDDTNVKVKVTPLSIFSFVANLLLFSLGIECADFDYCEQCKGKEVEVDGHKACHTCEVLDRPIVAT